MPDLPSPNLIPITQANSAFTDQQRLLEYFRIASGACDKWHKDIEHSRNLYNFEHTKVRMRPNETMYADPIYTNTVDLAVGMLLGNSLNWDVSGWSPSLAEERGSSRVEKYLAGVLEINSQRVERSLLYEIILNFVRDGAGCLYTVWDPDLATTSLASLPMLGPSGMVNVDTYLDVPLRVQAIDPGKIFVVPGGHSRFSKIFRVEEMSVWDVEQLYNITLERYRMLNQQTKMITRGKFIDCWEIVAKPHFAKDDPLEVWYRNRPHALQNSILFDDDFITLPRLMPGYGEFPYTLGFFKPVMHDKPEEWGHSILRPMETTVNQMEKSVNRLAHQIDIYSSMPIVSKTTPGRAVSIDPGLGTHVTLGPNEDIGFPTWPGNAPDVQEHLNFLSGRASQSGFPDIMYGAASGRMAGYAISMLTDQARIRLTQPTEHLSLMLTLWAKKVLDMTTAFAGERAVRVFGKIRGANFSDTVKGTDLDGYRVSAQVRPVFPNEETRKHAMATQVKGILSPHTIMKKYLDVQQPDEEIKRLVQFQALQNPIMQHYIMVKALKELAEEDGDEAAAMALQSLLAQGPQNPGGRPGEPNAPEQSPGMPSASGMPTPQEYGQEPAGQSAQDEINAQATASPGMTGAIG